MEGGDKMIKNKHLTARIIDILRMAKALEIDKLFSKLQEIYPNITRKQLHGTLSSLVKRGIVYHLTTGVYAHPAAYSGVK